MAKKKAEGEEGAEAPKMSKADAVRAALADGVEVPADAVGYIKSKFGIEMTTQQFSTAKFQAKKQAGGAKPAVQPRAAVSAPKPASNGHAGNAVELARQVKQLVDQYGAEAVRGMAGVFAE